MILAFTSSHASRIAFRIALMRSLADSAPGLVVEFCFLPTKTVRWFELKVADKKYFGTGHYVCIRIPKILRVMFLIFPYICNLFESTLEKLKVRIFLPKPHWTRFVNDTLIKQQVDYFGDGFLFLCAKTKPLWLVKKESCLHQSGPRWYYYYGFQSEKDIADVSRIAELVRIEDVNVKAGIMHYYGFNDYPRILKEILDINVTDVPEIWFFCGTTFSTTGRMTVEDEMNMYAEYLDSQLSVSLKRVLVIFKPHPVNLLPEFPILLSKKYCDNERVEVRTLSAECLQYFASIPFENVLLYLETVGILQKKPPGIIASSSGILHAARLFRLIEHVYLPFGQDILGRYLKEEYMEGRLVQEKGFHDLKRAIED